MVSRAHSSRPRALHRRLLLEQLELRTLLAFDPSPLEQELLLYVNRMRIDPQGEYDRLIARTNPIQARDPAINSALQQYQVDGNLLRSQWNSLTPVAPLAWNEALYNAAHTHNVAMIAARTQSHQLPGEPNIGQRLTNAGYPWTGYGESVFAYVKSPLMAHGGFAIDWGFGPGGIQSPPGHRENIMEASHREAGIALDLFHDPITSFGPQVVTKEFATRANIGIPFVVGAVWRDVNQSGWYEAGEGLGGATIEFTRAGSPTVTTTAMSAGGYQVQLSPGTWNARAIGAFGIIPAGSLVVSGSNRMLNFVPGPNSAPTISDITNRSIGEDETLNAPFTVGDANTPPGDLVVTATSTSGVLLPPGSLSVTGTGAGRMLVITPAANQNGSAVITVSVSDGVTTVSDTFTLTLAAVNDPPTIAPIAGLTIAEDTPTSVALTIGDVDALPANLTVTATGASAMFPPGSLTVTGSGATRTLHIVPAANQSSFLNVYNINVTVSDGLLSTTATFGVMVTPVNDAPTIPAILDQYVATSGRLELKSSITDVDATNPPNPVVSFAATSTNHALIPPDSISVVHLGTTLQVSIVPRAGQVGICSVTLSVGDGLLQSSRTFNVRVADEPFPWRNPAERLDVDNDTFVSAIDAVLIINLLNIGNAGQLPWREPPLAVAPFYDVDPDNYLAPIDAVLVINYLNANPPAASPASAAGEGEATDQAAQLAAAHWQTVAATDAVFSSAGLDGWLVKRRRR